MSTTTPHIPPGFSALTPYLQVSDASAFVTFLSEAFGAEVRLDHRDEGGQVVHTEVAIEGCVLEMSEARPEWPATRAAFHLYVTDIDAAHARAVAAGAEELMPPDDKPYGERASAIADRWGNNWYLATVTDVVARTSVP